MWLREQMRNLIKRVARRIYSGSTSADYRILQGPPSAGDMHGWRDDEVARRQQEAFAPLLLEMRSKKLREDFAALAEAIRLTGIADPHTLEVGCGGGWNLEVLEYVLRRPVRYIGVDYSIAMIHSAQQSYPQRPFVAADAYALPFADGSFDVVVSGTVLIHLPDYERSIRECRRVSSSCCVFHTVTVAATHPTTFLSKRAYGRPVAEVVFNEAHLLECLERCGLRVRHALPSIEYDLREVIGERTTTRTYVCDLQ